MLRALFIVVALDLFLGGGGRLLEIGPLTLRMALFGLALAATVFWLVGRRGSPPRLDDAERLALLIVAAFLLTHAGAAAIGWMRGFPPADIATEVKPLAFIAIAPFFALCLKTPEDAALAARLIRIAGPTLAVAYLTIWGALAVGAVDFGWLYPLMNDTGEFFFRGERFFFFKGFLYLGISLVFLLAEPRFFALPLAVLVAAALVLSLTRGFMLATTFAVMALLVLRDRRALIAIIPLVLAAWMLVLFWLPTMDTTYTEQRDLSNSVRQGDWGYFLDQVDLHTVLVGNGFGGEFNGRLLIESTFIWILWKAGLPGLLFWLAPFALASRWFLVAIRSPRYRMAAAAWWCAVLLVYIQTSTNPFLNNPIGMSIVLMAVFALRALATHGAFESRSKLPVPLTPLPTSNVGTLRA